jgi:hypothetical protein
MKSGSANHHIKAKKNEPSENSLIQTRPPPALNHGYDWLMLTGASLSIWQRENFWQKEETDDYESIQIKSTSCNDHEEIYQLSASTGFERSNALRPRFQE